MEPPHEEAKRGQWLSKEEWASELVKITMMVGWELDIESSIMST